MQNLMTIFRGGVMGLAEVIPGVSGSTLALIMGIYDDFINLLFGVSEFIKMVIKFVLRKAIFEDVKNAFLNINFKFGIFLLIGMGISIALFSHIITYGIEHYPEYVFGFFFGLVIASIVIPYADMTKKGIMEVAIGIVSFLVFFIVLGLKPMAQASDPSFIFVIAGGALAICAMVLPGISGSFILLLLGLYDYIIGLVKKATQLNINAKELLILILFAFGIVLGFVVFVRLLKRGLKSYPNYLFAFLIGLMLASLRVLWPFVNYNSEVSFSEMEKVLPWAVDGSKLLGIIVCIALGSGIVLLLKKLGKPSAKDNLD